MNCSLLLPHHHHIHSSSMQSASQDRKEQGAAYHRLPRRHQWSKVSSLVHLQFRLTTLLLYTLFFHLRTPQHLLGPATTASWILGTTLTPHWQLTRALQRRSRAHLHGLAWTPPQGASHSYGVQRCDIQHPRHEPRRAAASAPSLEVSSSLSTLILILAILRTDVR